MKRLIAKALLTGLIVSLVATPAQAMGWGKAKPAPVAAVVTWSQWFKDGLSSIKTSIYESSTETKVLVGCAALAAAGISYLIYSYLNPTDDELCATASSYIHEGNSCVARIPTIDPLDENLLNTIGFQLHQIQTDHASLSRSMQNSIYYLAKQKSILIQRIEKYQKANQYVSLTLCDTQNSIITLIEALQARVTILANHAHYFRMIALERRMDFYSKARLVKNDMPTLVPIIRHLAGPAQFPFLAFVLGLNLEIQNIDNELNSQLMFKDFSAVYTKKRAGLRQIKSDLEIIRATILGSAEYTADQARKDKFDAEQRRIALEQQRIAQENERIRLEAEKTRIEHQRLQLERENNQRERENHQQQNPNAGRRTQRTEHVECRVQ